MVSSRFAHGRQPAYRRTRPASQARIGQGLGTRRAAGMLEKEAINRQNRIKITKNGDASVVAVAFFS